MPRRRTPKLDQEGGDFTMEELSVNETETMPAYDVPEVIIPKPESIGKLVAFPQTHYAFTDDDLNKPKHVFRPQPLDVVIVANTADWGAVITRLARLMVGGNRVFVRSRDPIWSQHFKDVGESQNGYWCYATR